MDKKYTVKELIEALEKVENKDLVVSLEGCDCFGDWNGILKEMGLYEGIRLVLKRE